MPLTVYGLKNCDTCRKALKELADAGADHRFVDIRDEAGNFVAKGLCRNCFDEVGGFGAAADSPPCPNAPEDP